MTDKTARTLPETPFGVRLRAARKMAGMSMEDLAKKLGGLVTKQAIGKYEKGHMMPTPEVLAKLVEVLKDATWGASPLTTDDVQEALIRQIGQPPLIELPAGMITLGFRRQGLLGSLRSLKETRAMIADLEAAAERRLVALRESGRALTTDSQTEDYRCLLSCCSSQTEPSAPAMASPAGRKARYLASWAAEGTLSRIRFRAGGRLSAKTESALRYRIADHLQRYLEVETLVGRPAEFANPVPDARPRTGDEAESAAAELRLRWELGSGPVVNLLGVLEDNGIRIYEARGLVDFDGLSGEFGPFPFIAVNAEHPADRVRFTAAHELGHVVCGLDDSEGTEGACHAFGAAFLLPRSALERAFGPGRRKVTLGELGEVKETYGISLQAIMHRAHSLGFITDRQLRAFRETIKAKGWIVEEPVAYAGKERATRFRRLLHQAIAADILDQEEAARLSGVPAEELEKEIGEIF